MARSEPSLRARVTCSAAAVTVAVAVATPAEVLLVLVPVAVVVERSTTTVEVDVINPELVSLRKEFEIWMVGESVGVSTVVVVAEAFAGKEAVLTEPMIMVCGIWSQWTYHFPRLWHPDLVTTPGCFSVNVVQTHGHSLAAIDNRKAEPSVDVRITEKVDSKVVHICLHWVRVARRGSCEAKVEDCWRVGS